MIVELSVSCSSGYQFLCFPISEFCEFEVLSSFELFEMSKGKQKGCVTIMKNLAIENQNRKIQKFREIARRSFQIENGTEKSSKVSEK